MTRFLRRLALSSIMVSAVARPTLAQEPQASGGTCVVRVVPSATVYVDGRVVTVATDGASLDLPAGPHRLMVRHADYVDLHRVVDVAAGQTLTVTIDLADDAILKTVAGRRVVAATNPDLVKAIGFVDEGDFVPATATLEAVVRTLAGVPRYVREHALANLYLGVARAGVGRMDAARQALALAQQLDPQLMPRAADFPPRVLRLWQEAHAIDPSQPTEVDRLGPDAPGKTPLPSDRESVIVTPDAEFIVEDDTGTRLRMFAKDTVPCGGVLALERDAHIVSWTPTDATCSAAFRVPEAELRTPAAGPMGGVLLQFRSDRPAMTLMPAPDADLLAPDARPTSLNDLEPSRRVNLRRAVRAVTKALGRRASDSIFGLQVDLPIEELMANDRDFQGAAVRTRGLFGVAGKGRFELSGDGKTLQLMPTPATAQLMSAKASAWRGQELQVTGVFTRNMGRPDKKPAADAPTFAIAVATIEPTAGDYTGPAQTLSIRALTTTPPPNGELVRVVGRYSGQNLFGDLPADSRRSADDWVIVDGPFAVWVTGRRPDAAGIDGNRVRDTQLWFAVTGVVEERKGFVYLKARQIELTPPPDRAIASAKGPSLVPKKVAADIAFIAPVAGIEPASSDQQFLVRFTKPLDESTLDAHVRIRYADARDAALTRTSVTYYADRMFSIMVDPGEALQPGRTVELVLLPGIKDADGLPVAATSTPRVLTWPVRAGQ